MNNQFTVKIVVISLLGLSSCICAESGMHSQETLLTDNGFYIAADVGVAYLMDKEFHAVNPESHQLGSVGAVGGGFIGYDFGISPKARLAIEAFVDATGLKTNLQHTAYVYQMSQKYTLGIRLLPEYVFTPSLLGHLLVGYANSRFHLNDDGVYGLINTSYNQSGLQTGAGFTTAVTRHLFLRLDALYTFFPSQTHQGTTNQSYSNQFSQLAAEFSISYKFGG